MARTKKAPRTTTTLNPKGLKMGFATSLDSSTQPLPPHPLAGFKFEREAVQPRQNGINEAGR